MVTAFPAPAPSPAFLPVPLAFVRAFNGETYGKHCGTVPCNIVRAMHLAERVGFVVHCARCARVA
jgi:hypothetical protein